jgi:Delta3-Delta2-enoyl-CoA isomerase
MHTRQSTTSAIAIMTASGSPLFSVPIPAMDEHPGGAIVCTLAAPAVYLLTFTSPPDNRLTTPFLRALLTALDVVEFGPYEPGVVVTTSGIAKFYSNGLDLAHAVATAGFWPLLYSVWRRLLTYPMPTLALINGHAFAAGLMLATAHDYRLAPSPRGHLCVNELLFGAPLPPPMAALFREKLAPHVYRTLVLEAKRWDAREAVAAGIADAVNERGVDDALAFIDARRLVDKGRTGSYAALKSEMYRDLLHFLASPGLEAEDARFAAWQKQEQDRKAFGKVFYDQWAKENPDLAKPKL